MSKKFRIPDSGTKRSFFIDSIFFLLSVGCSIGLYFIEQSYLGGFVSACDLTVWFILLLEDFVSYFKARQNK